MFPQNNCSEMFRGFHWVSSPICTGEPAVSEVWLSSRFKHYMSMTTTLGLRNAADQQASGQFLWNPERTYDGKLSGPLSGRVELVYCNEVNQIVSNCLPSGPRVAISVIKVSRGIYIYIYMFHSQEDMYQWIAMDTPPFVELCRLLSYWEWWFSFAMLIPEVYSLEWYT